MEQGQLDQLLQPGNRVFALIDDKKCLSQVVDVDQNVIWVVCSDSGSLHHIDRDKAHESIQPAYLVRKGDYTTHYEMLGLDPTQQLVQGQTAGRFMQHRSGQVLLVLRDLGQGRIATTEVRLLSSILPPNVTADSQADIQGQYVLINQTVEVAAADLIQELSIVPSVLFRGPAYDDGYYKFYMKPDAFPGATPLLFSFDLDKGLHAYLEVYQKLNYNRIMLRQQLVDHKLKFTGKLQGIFAGERASRQKKDLNRPLLLSSGSSLQWLPSSVLAHARSLSSEERAVEICLPDVIDAEHLWGAGWHNITCDPKDPGSDSVRISGPVRLLWGARAPCDLRIFFHKASKVKVNGLPMLNWDASTRRLGDTDQNSTVHLDMEGQVSLAAGSILTDLNGKAGSCMIGHPVQAIFNGSLFNGNVSGYAFEDGLAWYKLEYGDGDQEEVSAGILSTLLCHDRSTATLSSNTQRSLTALADMMFNQDTALLVPAEVVQRANSGNLTGLLGGTEASAPVARLPGTASILYEAEGWGWTLEVAMQCGGERIVAPLAAAVFWVAPSDCGVPPLILEAVKVLSPVNLPQATSASRVRFAPADNSSKRSRVTYVECDIELSGGADLRVAYGQVPGYVDCGNHLAYLATAGVGAVTGSKFAAPTSHEEPGLTNSKVVIGIKQQVLLCVSFEGCSAPSVAAVATPCWPLRLGGMTEASVWSFKVLALHPTLTATPYKHVTGAPVPAYTIARMLPGHDVERWPLSGVMLHDPATGRSAAEVLAQVSQAAHSWVQKSNTLHQLR